MPPSKPLSGLAERRFGLLVVTLVSLGFLALLAAGIAAGWAMSQSQERAGWVNHTLEVEREVREFRVDEEQMQAARRGYLLAPEPSFRQAFNHAVASAPRALAALGLLTRDNARQKPRIDSLSLDNARLSALLAASMSQVDSGDSTGARARFANDGSSELIADVGRQTDTMLGEESRLLTDRIALQRRSVDTFYAVLTTAAALVIAVGVSSVLIILRYTRDLAASRSSLQVLNENLEDQVEARTVDLKRANDEIQRFAYIVSHDLLSPLVNVLGLTSELEASNRPIAQLVDQLEREVAAACDRGGAPGRSRRHPRGDRLHPHLHSEDGSPDQLDPEAVA